jgi:hypothetical protein
MKVTSEMMSPYCQQLIKELNLGGVPVLNLVPNLSNKTKYILHYLPNALLHKVHRVLACARSTWLKKYINFNNEKRKHVQNDFEKDFFKLMSNAVFGKTMENPYANE